jgi:hypothetical protein
MNAMNEQGVPSSRRILVALAFAALCALVVAVGASSQPADAARAKTLGKTKKMPNPNCPTAKRYRGQSAPDPPLRKSCQVLARVTGFQISGDGKKPLFKVPRDGAIVAWSIDLSRPVKEERKLFGRLAGTERLGRDPYARLAILHARGKGRFKLMKTSPNVKLSPHLASKPVFTLNRPLRVKKGRIIGLTTPTWSPSLAAGRGRPSDEWRASRKRDQCFNTPRNPNLVIETTKAHQKEGSTRRYGCRYDDRLTYWAYFVPK